MLAFASLAAVALLATGTNAVVNSVVRRLLALLPPSMIVDLSLVRSFLFFFSLG